MFRSAAVRVTSLNASALRLGDGHDAIDRRARPHLLRARRPLDDDAIDPLVGTQAEVKAAIVLAGESRTAVDDTTLAQISCLDQNLGADGAAIAAGPDQLETDPVVGAVGKIAIEHGGLILIG